MALFLCVHILVGKNKSDGKERRWKIFIGTLPAAPGIPEDADRIWEIWRWIRFPWQWDMCRCSSSEELLTCGQGFRQGRSFRTCINHSAEKEVPDVDERTAA